MFEGIKIKDLGVKRKMWYIYILGHPKINVIRNGKDTLRCLEKIKEILFLKYKYVKKLLTVRWSRIS